MQNIEIDTELSAIGAALEAWTTPTITGGQLASLIGRSAPNLDIRAVVGVLKGPGALTEFIRRYLSDVLDNIGRQGMDVLYRIKGRTVDVLPVAASPDVWRTFVSPNSTQHLVLSRTAGRLISRDVPAQSDDEIELAKASTNEHDAIRADFMGSLSKSMSDVLNSHASPTAKFETWIEALRTSLPEAVPKWGHYRRTRLSTLLTTRIDELQLEASLRQEILTQIRASETAAYTKQNVVNAAAEKQTQKPHENADTTARARRIAHAALELLSYDELRTLRLPLGAVLDAIQS